MQLGATHIGSHDSKDSGKHIVGGVSLNCKFECPGSSG